MVILAMAGAARICGARNDLWLDEILTLDLARQASSLADVLTNPSDFNHHLYTAYLYLAGPGDNELLCRMPSLVAGIGAVLLAAVIGLRRNAASAFFAMLLVGFSYVLILYSSEARGYSLAVFFSFLSLYLLDSYLDTRSRRTALLFSLSVVLGFVSQLTFLSFYLAALVWSGYRFIADRSRPRDALADALCCHAIPLLFLAAFYFVAVRRMVIMGGTPSPSLMQNCGAALAWSFGIPPPNAWKSPTCVIGGAALVAGIQLLWREKPDWGVFFLGAVLVFPALLVLVRGSDVIYVRYFIVGIAFLLLLCSFLLGSLYYQGWRGKIICALLLTCYLAANGWQMMSLVKYGRGHYCEAIRFLAERSTKSPITIGSDHDFRVASVGRFYAQKATGRDDVVFCRGGDWPRQGPEWLICHKESFDPAVPSWTRLEDNAGNRYEFVKAFPAAPLSGLHWFVYHHQL